MINIKGQCEYLYPSVVGSTPERCGKDARFVLKRMDVDQPSAGNKVCAEHYTAITGLPIPKGEIDQPHRGVYLREG